MSSKQLSPFILICTLVAGSGCASKQEDTIETRGEFVTRTVEGKQQFAFNFFWFNSIESQLDKRDRRNRLAAFLSGFSAPVSSEQKIRLEDQAAEKLSEELSARDMCQKGYDINNVIWRDRSLSLVGSCIDD